MVVGCDGGDEPSDVEGSTVIFGHVRQLEPEEDCGASHTSDAERQRVVDKAQLAIGEAVLEVVAFLQIARMTRDRECRVVPLSKILCHAGYKQNIFAPSQLFPKHDKLRVQEAT